LGGVLGRKEVAGFDSRGVLGVVLRVCVKDLQISWLT